ncbi:MAG: FtsW/RodA/SpoVE family cell cycle protein [Bacteroidetes bacterium]|nr:FtsW/RodA/SpoVE family cell cycle protein [Bacteroidota bacterium]
MFKRTQDKMFSELPQLKDSGNALLAKAKGDKFIWGIVILLSLVSILVVYSAASQIAYRKYAGNTEFFLFKQVAFSCLGLIGIYFIHQFNYTVFLKYATYLYILAIILLIYTLFFGTKKNDGVRWLEIPIVKISFQPSEFAKLALFVFLARFITKKQEVITDFNKGFLPALFIISLTCILILPSNFSTAALTFVAGIVVLFLGKANAKHITILFVVLAIAVIGGIMYVKKTYNENENATTQTDGSSILKRKDTWKKRIYKYATFKVDSSSSQENLSRMAIASGSVFWGMGPGRGQASNFLSEAENDFVFSVIIEEYGLIISAIVIFLYIAFLFRCIKIFRKCPYAFGSFLALGLSFALVIQAMANMAVSVGLLPVTGVTLPLVSMGGTSHILTCASIGIILSVGRNVEILEGKVEPISNTSV